MYGRLTLCIFWEHILVYLFISIKKLWETVHLYALQQRFSHRLLQFMALEQYRNNFFTHIFTLLNNTFIEFIITAKISSFTSMSHSQIFLWKNKQQKILKQNLNQRLTLMKYLF